MENFIKFKKSKIIILLLFFNQFLLNGYAVNFNKIDLGQENKNKFQKNSKSINILLTKENKNEKKVLLQEANKIEEFIDDIFDPNDFENFKYQKSTINVENNDLEKKEKNDRGRFKNIKQTFKRKKMKLKTINGLPLPSKSVISSSEFKVSSRGYVKLKGPEITLNLQGVDAIESLKIIAKLGNYGIVIVEGEDSNNEDIQEYPKITASFEQSDISDAFNSLLLSSNLQATNWEVFQAEHDVNSVYAYPNPFSPFTHNQLGSDGYVRFNIGNIVNNEVKLDIFNFAMEKVHSEVYNLNSYYGALKWNGRDQLGNHVANGVYFIRLNYASSKNQSPGDNWTKLIVVK